MSQTGKQIITIHILPDISRSKEIPTMKFCQLIKYNIKNIYYKNHAEDEAGRLVPGLFLFFGKALYEVEVCG